MQLLDVMQPNIGNTPQRPGDLPILAQNGYNVIRDSHSNSCDRAKEYPYTGRVLRHRCPLKNCSHRRINPRSSLTPCVYSQDCAGSGMKTQSCQPSTTEVPLNYHDPGRSSSTARIHPLPAYPEHLTLFSRGLAAPSQPQLSQNACASAANHPVIPRDYRRKAVLFIIKQLKVGGNQDIRKVQEIQRRIISLESQIYHTTTSQEEYVIKLASKLTAILQQLEQCRPSPVVAAHSQPATV